MSLVFKGYKLAIQFFVLQQAPALQFKTVMKLGNWDNPATVIMGQNPG